MKTPLLPLAGALLGLLSAGCATTTTTAGPGGGGAGVYGRVPPTSSLSGDQVVRVAEQIARTTGTQFIRNRGYGSMRPVFDTNSLLLIEEAPFDSLRIGDIVIYSSERGALVSHRIVERRGDRFWTMGDNNARVDNQYVTRENFRFRVWGVLYSNNFALGTGPQVVTAGASSAEQLN